MKRCIKCGKEDNSSGNFCVSCGGTLKEEIIEKVEKISKENEKEEYETKNVKVSSNTKKPFLYLFIISIIVIMGMTIYQIYDYNEHKNEIASLNSQINKLKKEKSNLEDENSSNLIKIYDYKDKADFLDDNIVFVLEGYGNYYYTYDQVQQVTQGNEYTYWAYNKEAAKSHGYRAWK